MNDYLKVGGFAALLHSIAYIVAIGLYLTILSPILDADPVNYLKLLTNYQGVMYLWILIAYWLSAFCLIVVSLAFYNKLKTSSPILLQTATVLGLIWAGLIIASGNLMLHDFQAISKMYTHDPTQAETVWLALMNVENGLVSGNELIGGLWVLFISWIALRTDWLPKAVNYIGLVTGLIGIISVIPLFSNSMILFGPSMIVWFACVGIAMLRSCMK